MHPPKPAMAPDRAHTATFETVRLMPTVADAAGESDRAIQRRAHRLRRSSSNPRNIRAKMIARKMTNALRSVASLLMWMPRMLSGSYSVPVLLGLSTDGWRIEHLVGELREGDGRQGQVEALEPEGRQGHDHAEHGADQHRPHDADRVAVLPADVGEHGGPEPGDGVVGEADLPGPPGERDERQHDDADHHEAGSAAQPDRRPLTEGGAEPRDPAVRPDDDDAGDAAGAEQGLPGLGEPLGPLGELDPAGLEAGLREEEQGDEQDHRRDGLRCVGEVGPEGRGTPRRRPWPGR